MKDNIKKCINKVIDFCLEHKLIFYTLVVVMLKCIIFQGFTLNKNADDFYLMTAFFWTLPRIQYYFAFVAIFVSLGFLLKGRAKLWYLYGLNLLVSVLLIADLWYFRGFNTMTSVHLFGQTSNLDNLWDTIASLTNFRDVVFILDLVILLFVLVKFKSIFISKVRSIKLFVVTFAISVILIGIVPFKSHVLGISDSKAIFSMLDANISAYNLSPIGYHILNAYSYFTEDSQKKLSEDEKKSIKNWFEEKQENLPDNKYKGLLENKNVIVLQLESFENFVINREINGQEITPNINKLLKNSIFFDSVLEQVNQGTTSDAEFMLNTSIYPLRDGSAFFRFPYNKYISLPELLEKKGYESVSIHSDKGSYWNWMINHSSIGYNKSFDSTSFEHDESIGMGLSDGSLLRQIVPILKDTKQPFVNFTVTLSNHAPFDIDSKYRELKLDSDLEKSTIGGYIQSVRYVDTQIGKFIEMLKKEGLLDNTVIVLYGDHEGIHKYYQKDVDGTKNLPQWMYNNEMKVPFIVYNPSLAQEKVSTIGGQADVMPTLAYLMGIPEKEFSYSAMGKNLLKTNKNYAILKSGKTIGTTTEAEEKHALKGLEIADLIIKSNYFIDNN